MSGASTEGDARSGRGSSRSKGRSVYTQILIVSCAVLVPMLGAMAILGYQIERIRQSTLAIKAAYEAIDAGHRLKSQFAETQMAVQAYALTGDDTFLIAYHTGRREWSEAEMAASGSIRREPDRAQRFIQIEDAVDAFFMDWETRLGTLTPGSDDPEAQHRIDEDRERVRKISHSISSFVTEEEMGIRDRLLAEEKERGRAYVGSIATSVIAVALLGVFAAVMGQSIARPIRQVSEAARLLGEGEWNKRVNPRGGRETRVLAKAFNRMADTLAEARDALAVRNQELEETAWRLATLNEDMQDRQKESEDFLYVLSHDLRAPLINIQGFSRRLQNSMVKLEAGMSDGAGPDESAKQFKKMNESLKFINAGTAKIDQLIARLLEIARLTTRPNEPGWIDMEELARNVVDACQFQLREKGIEATVGGLPFVFGDPVQINQVVTNLVDNAIKYMGDDRPVKRIAITGVEQGGRFRFAVQDTGAGISRDNKEKVFRMFARLDPGQAKGEGIGLTAVRTIVNRHRGRIWVESTEGVGSTFYFTLPKRVDGAPPLSDEARERNRIVRERGEESVVHV